MTQIVENSRGQRFVPFSCKFKYELWEPIHRLSRKNKISFNQMINDILKTHPRLV